MFGLIIGEILGEITEYWDGKGYKPQHIEIVGASRVVLKGGFMQSRYLSKIRNNENKYSKH